jgi:hypothetical protein
MKLYHSTWNDQTKPSVPLSEIPAGVEACFWTGSNSGVWLNPPTTRQVQTVAGIAVNGGANPYKPISPATDIDTYPAGTFVLLDGEGRGDAAIERMVNQYKSYGGGKVPFGVYGFWPVPEDGAAVWRAFDNPYWLGDAEKHAASVAKLAAKMPVLVNGLYLENNKPDDQQFLAADFDLAVTRRMFPNKPVYLITRGDRIVYRLGADGLAERDADGNYITSTEVMSDAELWRLALWTRARFDGCICWGVRADNIGLMRVLADVDGKVRARRAG